jgi:phosphotransferase system enzyme I (PtsI)
MALFHRSTIFTAAHTIENVEAETVCFHSARKKAISQLQNVYDKEQAAVFEIHQMMLDDPNMEVGIMIETSAAAIISDELAKEVDFLVSVLMT